MYLIFRPKILWMVNLLKGYFFMGQWSWVFNETRLLMNIIAVAENPYSCEVWFKILNIFSNKNCCWHRLCPICSSWPSNSPRRRTLQCHSCVAPRPLSMMCSICCTFTTHRLRTIGSFPLLFLQTKQWFHPWNSWRPSLYSVRQGAQFRSPFCVVPAPWRPWANTSRLFLYDGATQTLPVPLLASDLQQHADHLITYALHFIAVEATENVNHKDKIMHHLVTNCN